MGTLYEGNKACFVMQIHNFQIPAELIWKPSVSLETFPGANENNDQCGGDSFCLANELLWRILTYQIMKKKGYSLRDAGSWGF